MLYYITQMTTASKITLEIGKTYVTRDGQRVRIEAETECRGTFRMRGVDEYGRPTWRSRKGRFDRLASHLDLVREG